MAGSSTPPAKRLRRLLAAALLLAGAPAVAASDAEGSPEIWNYRVSRGDTLIAICEQFLERPADWARLQKLNGISNERRLQPDSTLRIPVAWIRRSSTVAAVVFVQGAASLLRSDAGGPPTARPLAVGDEVRPGDRIRTAAGASVSLRLADRSRVLVTPDAELRIVQLLQLGRAAIPKVDLQIDSGGAEVEVAPAAPGRSFEIRTPAVNLGVRGTDFRARVEPGTTIARVEVREGRVAAGDAARQITIPGNFGTVAEAGRPIEKPTALLAAPELGTLPKRLQRLPLQFAWPAVAGARGYRAQVLAPDEPVRLLLDARFAANAAAWPDLPDGSYRLRVRAIDARGIEGQDALLPFVLKARPEAPFTRLPADGARVHGEATRFEWAGVDGARRYRLQIARDAAFESLVVDDAAIETTSRIVALSPGPYHWRLASIATAADGSDDPGPFGDARSFVQRAIPQGPALPAAQAVDGGLEWRWQAPPQGGSTRWQIAADREFNRLLVDETTAGTRARMATPPPGRYYLRAAAIDADGFAGPFGAVQQFEVPQPPPPKWLLLLPLGLLLVL